MRRQILEEKPAGGSFEGRLFRPKKLPSMGLITRARLYESSHWVIHTRLVVRGEATTSFLEDNDPEKSQMLSVGTPGLR